MLTLAILCLVLYPFVVASAICGVWTGSRVAWTLCILAAAVLFVVADLFTGLVH